MGFSDASEVLRIFIIGGAFWMLDRDILLGGGLC